jgi:hypothetical protein
MSHLYIFDRFVRASLNSLVVDLEYVESDIQLSYLIFPTNPSPSYSTTVPEGEPAEYQVERNSSRIWINYRASDRNIRSVKVVVMLKILYVFCPRKQLAQSQRLSN